VQPTVREKEHVLAFRVADKTYVNKPTKCTFPYDLDEIMSVGHALLEHIPEQPAQAEFPVQPWQSRVDIQYKRFRSLWKIRAPFRDQEVEVWADESPATVWRRIMAGVPKLPSYHEIGLTPKGLGVEMIVTMPRREIEVTIGATIGRKWVQARTTTDWLRDPERLVQDCVKGLGAPPALVGRLRIDDTHPWEQGDILTAVEADNLRPIQWNIPAKDATRYKRSWETQDTVHWIVQYDKEYGKLLARERGNWYEAEQLTGPKPPYSTEMTLELRSGRQRQRRSNQRR
jgi:hypothetical protein